MRIIHICVFILFVFALKAQDSLPKLKLKLFDISLRAAGTGFDPNLSQEKISSLTRHKEFTNEPFTTGYDDKARRFNEWFGPNNVTELGLGSSFKIHNTSSRFLKRLRPHAGLFFSRQCLEYGIGFRNSHKTDSLIFIDPAYPSVRADSVSIGRIFYNYTSKQAHIEAGALYDVILNRHFGLYTGLLYGFGVGYENTFSISRNEFYYYDMEGLQMESLSESLDRSFKEPTTTTSRFTVPIGFYNRFNLKSRYAVGFLVEARPTLQIYKIKNEKTISFSYVLLNIGLRFYFQQFK